MRLTKKIKNIFKWLLDLVFPVFCLGCGKEGVWLCDYCAHKIPFYPDNICPVCDKATLHRKICTACLKDTPFDFILPVFDYQQPVVQEIIHNIKYRYIKDTAEYFHPVVQKFLDQPELKKKCFNKQEFVIIPVPLHKKRLLKRGFNQSELLARIFGEYLGYQTVNNALLRVKHTVPQMSLDKNDRANNLKSAFECVAPDLIKNKNVIIVDDVYTTGTTIKEVAAVLKQNSCKSIGALVMAKEGLKYK